MSLTDAVWAFGLLGALFLALALFTRRRRKTEDFRESAVLKERLPGWLRQFEVLIACAFVVAGVGAVAWLFAQIARPPNGVGSIYFAVGLMLIVVPWAFLAANGVSWLFPPSRAANLKAMHGLKVSFRTMNSGLLGAAAVSTPLGLAILAVAMIAPWR